MLRVSFTKFLDFVAQSGEPKAGTAIEVWSQSDTPYDPKKDYHRRVREYIIRLEKGSAEFDQDEFILQQNSKKQENYKKALDQYFKWRNSYIDVEWRPPARGIWSNSEFEVSVNPELGLELDCEPHFIKLYFKSPALSALKAQMGCLLMHKALAIEHPKVKLSILDIRLGRLHTYAKANDKLEYLLLGETAHMAAMLAAIRGRNALWESEL